jgi:hypothetical protein
MEIMNRNSLSPNWRFASRIKADCEWPTGTRCGLDRVVSRNDGTSADCESAPLGRRIACASLFSFIGLVGLGSGCGREPRNLVISDDMHTESRDEDPLVSGSR